jgi:adenylate cyclase class IV
MYALGVTCVVRKVRREYCYQNYKIHLDDVEHLGDYLEAEVNVNLN